MSPNLLLNPFGHKREKEATKYIKVVQEDSEEDSNPLNTIIEHNQVQGKSNPPYTVTVSIDGTPQKLEIDTCACVTILSEETFKKLLPQKELCVTRMKLSMYSGERLEALGECEVTVTYQAQKKTLSLIVVKGNGPTCLEEIGCQRYS